MSETNVLLNHNFDKRHLSDDLYTVICALKWTADHPRLQTLQVDFHNYVVQRVNLVFEMASEDHRSESQDIFSGLTNLGATNRLRFFLAPETFSRVRKGNGVSFADNLTFFGESLLAEGCYSGERTIDDVCWSARGDFCTSSANEELASFGMRHYRNGFASQEGADGVSIDLCSPYRGVKSLLPADTRYFGHEAELLIQHLKGAYDEIRLINRHSFAFVRRFTQTVSCAKKFGGTSHGSSSSASHIGRVILYNAHLMDGALLVSTLIHEAIHQALNIVDVFHPLVNDDGTARIVSPWTAKQLSLANFVQACFVWYGLLQFWRVGNEVMKRSERSQQEQAQAWLGFRDGAAYHLLSAHKHLVAKETFEAIRLMCD
jgi:hypothetical protein